MDFLFWHLYFYSESFTACMKINGTRITDLDERCREINGYQPTYNELVSYKTGRPSLFETFTADLMKSTAKDRNKDGFMAYKLYGLCLLRNETEQEDREKLKILMNSQAVGVVQNQARPTITFPLLSLINAKHYSNGTLVTISNTYWSGMPSFRYQCTGSTKLQTDKLFYDALKSCKIDGFNSYPQIRQRKLSFKWNFVCFLTK